MSRSNLNDFSRKVTEVMPLMLREFAKREQNELAKGKISFPQMVTLDYASHTPKLKMTDLARLLSIKMSSATVLIDGLIARKMITRQRDDKDRRVVWVMATAKGKKVVSQIMEEKRRVIQDMFAFLSDEEREDYLSALMKVRAHLLEKREK